MHGWAGKILRVDLTDSTITEVPTGNYAPKFMGGWGIMAKIAWDELPPEVGALDPENRLMMMTGPLTGTLAPASGRTETAAISPITYPTEDYARSGFGGHWGTELKLAGYDGIIVQGKAKKPSWITVNDGEAEIRDASSLWGLNSYKTQEKIWEELGSSRVQVACIGPAGENRVRFAVVSHGNGSAAGMGGMGCVMGSKNLKAITVRGTRGIDVAHPGEFAEYAFKVQQLIYNPKYRPPFGLDQIGVHRLGFGGSSNPELKEYMKESTVKAMACTRCPTACRPYFRDDEALVPGVSNFCFGLWYMSHDLAKHGEYTNDHIKATALTDAYGVDVREIQRILKWLKGCYDEGLLSENETGISFDNFGDYDFAESFIEKIAHREGFGDRLAEGVVRASYALDGAGLEHIDNVNRGFEAFYQPRAWPTNAIEAATGSSARLVLYHTWAARTVRKNPGYFTGTGWLTVDEWTSVVRDLFDPEAVDHVGDAFYDKSKAVLAKWLEDYRTAVCGCLVLCDWVYPMWWSWYSDEPNRRGFSPEGEAKMLSLATGLDMSVEDMIQAGERVRNLERAIMVREGRRREQDTLSDLYFNEPIEGFPVPGYDGVFVPQTRSINGDKFEQLKEHYYRAREWDLETGIPSREKLEELGLSEVSKELWQ